MPSQVMSPDIYIPVLCIVLQNIALVITTYQLYTLLRNTKGNVHEKASFYERFNLSKHKLLRLSTLTLVWIFELVNIIGFALKRATDVEFDTPTTALIIASFLLHALIYLETFERVYFALPGNSKLKIFRVAICCWAVITFTATCVSSIYISGNDEHSLLDIISTLVVTSHFLTCICIYLFYMH